MPTEQQHHDRTITTEYEAIMHLGGGGAVAYPGFYIGGCLTVCARSAREKFYDHAHFN